MLFSTKGTRVQACRNWATVCSVKDDVEIVNRCKLLGYMMILTVVHRCSNVPNNRLQVLNLKQKNPSFYFSFLNIKLLLDFF